MLNLFRISLVVANLWIYHFKSPKSVFIVEIVENRISIWTHVIANGALILKFSPLMNWSLPLSTLYRGLHLGLFVKCREEQSRGSRRRNAHLCSWQPGRNRYLVERRWPCLNTDRNHASLVFQLENRYRWCVEQRKTDYGYAKELVFPARIAGKNFFYNVDR